MAENYSLVLQDFRLARAGFESASNLTGMARLSAVNGALRLISSAYQHYISVMCPAEFDLGHAHSLHALFTAMAAAFTPLVNYPKCHLELTIYADPHRELHFFAELERSLAVSASDWNTSQNNPVTNNASLIASTRTEPTHWTEANIDLCLNKLSVLFERIEQAIELSGEY